MVGENRFGAIAVMRVEVPDGNALHASFQRIERGNGNVIEIAEAHRPIARRVMSWRAHQTERAAFGNGCTRDLDRRASRASSMIEGIGIRRTISVKILRGIGNAAHVFRRMRVQQHLLCCYLWHSPFPERMMFLKERNRSRNALRAFYVSDTRVFDRTRIVENQHVTQCWNAVKSRTFGTTKR